MGNQLLDAALHYAALGYRVFPLSPGEKIPLAGSRGFYDGTTDPASIEAWWEKEPNANIGIWTDGLFVVDVDGENNPWLGDAAKMNSLAEMPMQITPRGGMHFIMRQPAERAWSINEGDLADHVDVRANGGYIVAAPSVLQDGRKYQWIGDHGPVAVAELPEPPQWLVDAMDALSARQSHKSERLEPGDDYDGGPIPDGRRNSTLTSIAGSIRRIALGASAIYAALVEVNKARCTNPLPEAEVYKIARSVSRYPPDQIATIMAEGGIFLDDPPKGPTDPGELPHAFCEVPGLIGEIVSYTLKTSMYPQPVLALAGALSLMATITGHKIQDSRRLQTNLYAIGIARSGAGKEHARKINKLICEHSLQDDLLGPENFASAAGIISVIETQRVTLFQLDELGKLLRTLNDPKASHLYGIPATLMKLYSSAGGQFNGNAYADTKKIKRIQWPHACLYGTTTPTTFYESLTRESLEDGFLARVLVFEAPRKRPRKQKVAFPDPPERILTQVNAWRELQTGGNLSKQFPQPIGIVYSDGAEDSFQELEDQCQNEQDHSEEKLESIWTRTAENARKLSMLYAASRDGIEVREVDEKAARWAAMLCLHLTQKLVFSASAHVSETPLESRLLKIKIAILATGAEGLSRRDLSTRFCHVSKRERDEIVENLLETGRIVKITRKTGSRGPLAVVYVGAEFSTLCASSGT